MINSEVGRVFVAGLPACKIYESAAYPRPTRDLAAGAADRADPPGPALSSGSRRGGGAGRGVASSTARLFLIDHAIVTLW